MSDPIGLALVILGLPLAAAVLAALLNTCGGCRRFAHVPLMFGCAAAAVLAVMLLLQVHGSPTSQFVSKPLAWFAAGNLRVHFTIAVDPLSCVMLAMVTFIATWIAIFSGGYMKGDRGFGRFFAVMSLFVFSMCGLVLANNLLLLLAFWEGVGVCSYLLVGYYFDKPSAAAAARKAFLVTRLGDVGFLLGIFLFWHVGGYHTDLTALFENIQKQHQAGTLDIPTVTAACVLLFCGAVGKSAQFPLYVWLPDAMEGPTPVSALIHAATMVTAGVYLLARCAPLFVLAPDAQLVVAWSAGITAILAAFLALAQNDLKRVLAYSTVSQLGYMFLALSTAGAIAPALAVTAAMFHLFTHAFFKALLFLASGSVMHAMGNVIDMRRFGGLRNVMPLTDLTFLVGAAALAGVPPLAGFWSKDLVLDTLFEASAKNGTFYLMLIVALVTAGLTAFYTFRAYFLTFVGEKRIPPEAGHHAHESPPSMTVPLGVLAVGALAVGLAAESPASHAFSRFLARTPSLQQAGTMAGLPAHGDPHLNLALAGVSVLLAAGGIAMAYLWYGRGGPERVPAGAEPVFALSRGRLYVDEIYHALFVKPAEVLALIARQFDGFLDAVVRLLASTPQLVGAVLRPIQNGLVQFYALSMVLGLAVLLSFVAFRAGR